MNKKPGKKTILNLPHEVPDNIQLTITTGIISLAAALSAVAFLFLTNFIFSKTYLIFVTKSKSYFVLASFLLISSTSLLVGYLLNVISPEAAGSGIPQIKTAYWKELGYMKWKNVLVKFFGGALSIGGGNSLGREGPSVFIGSGVASNLDGIMGRPRQKRQGAAIIGAAAGLAAAFNTPIAAITFAIEEILGDLNSRYLGRVVLSSVVGAFVVYAILGRQPAFALPSVDNVSWIHYLLVPIVALVASLAGIIFQTGVLRWRGSLNKQKRIPKWLLPLFGGIITWIIGTIIFLETGKIGVFGLGYNDLSSALNNQLEWKIAGLLVVAKLLATMAGYSFGGCGGIFAPSLFIGGLSGYFLGGLASTWIPLTPADHIVLAVVGMSACLGAIVQAPLTSILIAFEMTHQFSLVPGLLLGAIISQATARFVSHLNFYDALLVQDGHELHKVKPPQDLRGWQNLPLSAVANPKPVFLEDFSIKAMQELVDRFPYNFFPVIEKGVLTGIVSRQDLVDGIKTGTRPMQKTAVICTPGETIHEASQKFITHSVSLVLVGDSKSRKVSGLLTLHDLIRAQASWHS
jgi:CIC family chloride channel protein